jgi:hypothetical protein
MTIHSTTQKKLPLPIVKIQTVNTMATFKGKGRIIWYPWERKKASIVLGGLG